MKLSHSRLAAIATTLLVFLSCTLPGQRGEVSTSAPEPVVVGTFDSRGLLMAYVRSEAFSEYVSAQRTDVDRMIERARAQGDAALVEDLEALGPAMQHRIHLQGFGTAPVDGLLARIEERLPELARQAGVDLIVSRWDLSYRDPEAKLVDVTDLLARELGADEDGLRAIHELMQQEPLSHEELEGDAH